MLEKIKNAVVENMNTVMNAEQVFRDFRKYNDANYTGNLKTSRVNEAMQKRDEVCAASRKQAFETCKAVLSDIREKANAAVVQPLPDDFVSTLEGLKVTKDISKAEIDALMGKYKGNYFAYRAICDVVGGRIAGFYAVTIDDVVSSLAALESLLHRVIYDNQSADAYWLHLITDSDYLTGYDEFYTAFLDGRFSEAGKTMQEQEQEE